jgi:hypothetical protein
MFSTTVTTQEMIKRYVEGLSNDMILQRFYNGDLGLAYTAKGAKIDMELIKGCTDDYTMPSSSQGICVMGADVGKMIHVIIIELLPEGKKRLVAVEAVREAEDVEYLWARYNCKRGVIDALPETRIVKKLCSTLTGMFMSIYVSKVIDTADRKTKMIRIHRTQTLDAVKEMLFKQEILLPRNIETIPEFCDHLTSSTRVFDEKSDSYSWIESGPDHYLHAFGYALKAEKIIYLA